jgi:hypothetical protein
MNATMAECVRKESADFLRFYCAFSIKLGS